MCGTGIALWLFAKCYRNVLGGVNAVERTSVYRRVQVELRYKYSIHTT